MTTDSRLTSDDDAELRDSVGLNAQQPSSSIFDDHLSPLVLNIWNGHPLQYTSDARLAKSVDMSAHSGGQGTASFRRTGHAWCARFTGELEHAARTTEHLTVPYVSQLFLTCPIEGSLGGTQEGRQFRVHADEVVALRNDRTFTLDAMTRRVDVAVIAVPVDHLRIWEIDPDEVAGTVWNLSSIAIHTRDFIAAMIADQPTDPLIDLPRLDEILTRMSLVVLSCRDPASAPPGGVIEIRKSVLHIVDEQYSDPRLSCASIAWQMHSSTRSLHRAFAGTGTTVAGLIMAKRLAGAAMELAHGDPDRTIAAVARAHGFRGADQFTRNFKRHYGTSPAEFRRLLDMHARAGMQLRSS